MLMKTSSVASMMTALLAGSALAADMPARMMTKAVPYVEAFSWTGLYVGGNVGGAWGNPSFTNLANTSTFGGAAVGSSFSENSSGFIGGGQIGYNWQVNQIVYGLEASFSGATVKGNSTNFVDDTFENRLKSLALVTARIGYASNNWLFYGKGGYAGGMRSASVSDTGVLSPGVGSGSQSIWHNGWTLGTGVEYGLTRNWILGLEYDYVRLNSENYQLSGTDVPRTSYLWSIKSDYHIVTGRLSYKF
jgi:outer membrane immunogenic protein